MKGKAFASAVVAAVVCGACTPGSVLRNQPAAGNAVQVPRFPVEKFTLPNGLRVLLSVDRSAPVVAVDVHYHVGSKNEQPGRTGFAHLFEHLMFLGSTHVPGTRHRVTLEEVGGGAGAVTLVDYTEYFSVMPSNYLETALWLEADRMGFLVPALTSEKLNVGREVVNNERRENYINPTFGAEPLIAMPAVYPAGHPYSWRTIGSEEDLAKAELDDVREFFTRYYVPNNALLTIVGDIDVAATRQMVRKYFGDLPRGQEIARPAAPPVTLETDNRVVLEDAKASLPEITFIWPTVGWNDRDEVPLKALGMLLAGQRNTRTGDRTARLTKLLVYDRQLATSVEAYQGSDELAGEFYMHISPRPGVTLTQLEAVMDSAMRAIATTPATPMELERLKNYMTVNQITGLQSVLSKSRVLGISELMFGDPHHYASEAARVAAIQPAELSRVATRYFSKGRVVISKVPAGKLELISRPEVPYRNVTPGAAPIAPKSAP